MGGTVGIQIRTSRRRPERICPNGPSDVTLICMQGHTPEAAPGVPGGGRFLGQGLLGQF